MMYITCKSRGRICHEIIVWVKDCTDIGLFLIFCYHMATFFFFFQIIGGGQPKSKVYGQYK